MMALFRSAVRKLHRDESGQGLVEYGLLAVLIAIAVVAVLYVLGGNLKNVFTDVSDCLSNTSSC